MAAVTIHPLILISNLDESIPCGPGHALKVETGATGATGSEAIVAGRPIVKRDDRRGRSRRSLAPVVAPAACLCSPQSARLVARLAASRT